MARKLDQSPPALRAFSLLEAVARADKPLTLGQITEAARLPKPTVHRMIALLAANGLIVREPDGRRYTVGPRLSAFGLEVLLNSSFRTARHLILQALVEQIGETCNFTMLDGAQVVYLDRVETPSPLRMNLQTGSRVPLHCTASGKLLLAMLPKAKRDRLTASLPLPRHTAKTIVDAPRFERELKQIRAQRYSTDDEEYFAGLVCVAVPVRDGAGRTCAALAVHAPMSRMPLARQLEYLPALKRAAEQMARTLID
jgi:IclR family acetate operon transcriptional repressor